MRVALPASLSARSFSFTPACPGVFGGGGGPCDSSVVAIVQYIAPRTLVEFMYLVFTRMRGESYRRRLKSLLLCLCDVFQALITSLNNNNNNNKFYHYVLASSSFLFLFF